MDRGYRGARSPIWLAVLFGVVLVGCGDPPAPSPPLTPEPLSINAIAAVAAIQGDECDVELIARGGTGTLAWSVASGALPPGLALIAAAHTAHVRGRPTKRGAFAFEIAAADARGQRATRSVELVVSSSLAIEGTLPDATEGAPYRAELTAMRGSGGYRWRITAGALPAGLSLSGDDTPTAALAGTPVPGRFAFTLTVADADGSERSRQVELWVQSSLAIEGDPRRALIGEPFDLALAVRGGLPPYEWRVLSGRVPDLELSIDGDSARLHGTPIVSGQPLLQLEVADANGGRIQRDLRLDLRDQLQITTAALPSGQHGIAYTAAITGAGGLDDAYHWEVISGALPSGMTLATDGAPTTALTGTPTANGTFQFTVRLSTPAGARVDRALRLTIADRPPQLVGRVLTAGRWGDDYAETITGTSDVGGDIAWERIEGWLPPGVELEATTSTTIILRGRPALSGPFEFKLQMTDPGGVAQASFRVDVDADNPFHLVSRTLPGGRVDDHYTAGLETRNAFGAVVWRVTTGELPPGIALASDGPRAQLTGTPTTAGFYRFIIEASADGVTSSRALAMLVRPLASWAVIGHSERFGGPYSTSVVDVTRLPATPVVVKNGTGGWIGDASVSPDGRYATFTAATHSNPNKLLYLVDLRGGPHPAELLTGALRSDRGNQLIWSPDGAFALVAVQVASHQYDMHILDLTGATHTFRSLGQPRADLEIAWSPDARSVAFPSFTGDVLYVASRTGSSWSTRAIPTGSTALWPLHWLPDSSGLLFSGNGGLNQGLFFVDTTASVPRAMRLTPPRLAYSANFLPISADGSRLLLAHGARQSETVWMFDAGRQAFAQPLGMTGGLTGDIHATWSPDSRHVLVERNGFPDDDTVYVVDSDAPPSTVLSPLPLQGLDGRLRNAAWTPDGRSLLVTTDAAAYRVSGFSSPIAELLLGSFLEPPRTWFLGTSSPFLFIQQAGLHALNLSLPAEQRTAHRIDTIGRSVLGYREDRLRGRVYYIDANGSEFTLYAVDASGPVPGSPIEIMRAPSISPNLGFSD